MVLCYGSSIAQGNLFMHIRTAQVKDIQSILRLANQINQQHFQGAPSVFSDPNESQKGNEEYWLGLMLEPTGVFFVAENDHNIIGFVVARITQNLDVSFIQGHKVCRVNTIVVDDQIQSSGIGKSLMAKVTQWAKAQEAVEMRLEVMEFNEQALGFYEKLGMHTQSRIMAMPIE